MNVETWNGDPMACARVGDYYVDVYPCDGDEYGASLSTADATGGIAWELELPGAHPSILAAFCAGVTSAAERHAAECRAERDARVREVSWSEFPTDEYQQPNLPDCLSNDGNPCQASDCQGAREDGRPGNVGCYLGYDANTDRERFGWSTTYQLDDGRYVCEDCADAFVRDGIEP